MRTKRRIPARSSAGPRWVPAFRRHVVDGEVALLRWPTSSDGEKWIEREVIIRKREEAAAAPLLPGMHEEEGERERAGIRHLALCDSGGIVPVPTDRAGLWVLRVVAKKGGKR